jgi:hypothetical protein
MVVDQFATRYEVNQINGGQMIRTFIACTALLFATQTFACSVDDILGTYASKIVGGGDDSKTAFAVADGTLVGEYWMSNTKSDGTLVDLALNENVLTGTWHDKFGTGEITFKFSDDCKSFDGQWSAGVQHGEWTGVRE